MESGARSKRGERSKAENDGRKYLENAKLAMRRMNVDISEENDFIKFPLAHLSSFGVEAEMADCCSARLLSIRNWSVIRLPSGLPSEDVQIAQLWVSFSFF